MRLKRMFKATPPPPPSPPDVLAPYVDENTHSTLDLVAAVLRLLSGENRDSHKDRNGETDEQDE